MYNSKIFDRLLDLKHVGKLKNYNALGASDKKFDENDKVKLFLNISKEGVILNASFKAVGCVGVIVASSYVCEMLEDKDIKYARKLDVIAVNKYITAFPEAKQHAILVVLNALKNALKAYDKAIASGEIKYYAKIVTKTNKKAKVSKYVEHTTSTEKVESNTKSQNTASKKESTSSITSIAANISKIRHEKEESMETTTKESVSSMDTSSVVDKADTKKSTKTKVSKDSVKVEKKAEAKSKATKTVESKEIESSNITSTSIDMTNAQITFDFEKVDTKASKKAEKEAKKTDKKATKIAKAEEKKTQSKAKVEKLNKIDANVEVEDTDTTSSGSAMILVAREVEEPEVEIIEDASYEDEEPIIVTKPTTIRKTKTTTTKKTTRVSSVEDSHVATAEHQLHTVEEVHEVDGNVVNSRKESIEKMNSSLLRLQTLQKNKPAVEDTDVVIIESKEDEDVAHEESLNKLKALVASAKQNKVSTAPVKKTVEKSQKVQKENKKPQKKVEEVKPATTSEKSVKYVRIDEFEEKAKKEKKGIFSRIFGKK